MNGVVQIRCLGSLGRLGNMLFQYAFARSYARSVGATLETPPWIGQRLFGLDDQPISKELPSVPLDQVPADGSTNINLHGYYQHARAFAHYTLTDVRQWFNLADYWRKQIIYEDVPPIAVHVRRGDYVTHHSGSFCIIEDEAYRNAIEKYFGPSAKSYWIREDREPQLGHISGHHGLEWLVDFYGLMTAKILFRANSTFSWWAATLGQNRVFSPVVEGLRGHQRAVPFIEGNWPRCTDQPNVSDYNIKP